MILARTPTVVWKVKGFVKALLCAQPWKGVRAEWLEVAPIKDWLFALDKLNISLQRQKEMSRREAAEDQGQD